MKKYKYKFSVIIPIYNVEEYLRETIESVINQTIGFEENIQIILVNDGSPDNSEAICLEYKDKYPKNITYIKKENGGVSSARNVGIKYIEGKYTNFLDSDDKWELDAFAKVYDFFEKHYEETDVVSCLIEFFEAKTGFGHPLNYKFHKDRIVDIFNDYNHIQLHVTSSFIKSAAIQNIRFDENLKYSEDAKFLTELILKLEHIGFMGSVAYKYRIRLSETSAMQSKNSDMTWYTSIPRDFYLYMFDFSKKKYGYVIPYIQYIIAYDYQWRVKELTADFPKNTLNEYQKISKELFKEIDDYIILKQNSTSYIYKLEMLKFKYGNKALKMLRYENHKIYFNNLVLVDLLKTNILNLKVMNFKDDNLELKGFVDFPFPKEDYIINLVINKKERYQLDLQDTKLGKKKFFNEVFLTNKGFKITIPIKNLKSLYFELVIKDKFVTNLNINTDLNAKIDSKIKSYYIYKDQIYYYYNKRIRVKPNSLKNRIRFFLRYAKNVIEDKKWKVLVFILAYSFLRKFKTKEIWLISDRVEVANDNGMHLFKYISKQKNHNIKVYFVIKKDSKDYSKMKKIGKVVNHNSIKYKLLFLLSDKIISSQADLWVHNAFGKAYKYYHHLYNFKLVFLQHGITQNDLSSWLNDYDKNFSVFVTSAEEEYHSILNGEYGYNKEIVRLTGFPRYDNLYDEKQKLIAIMPTWRQALAGKPDRNKVLREYNPEFKNSEYFQFYNNLINDKRVLETMKKYGYTGFFVVHPFHMKNYIDFEENEMFKVVEGHVDYQKIFREASLLVSDYSSVLFDFAYLKKPILYAQFDKKFFFSNHTCTEGYFSYENDGFGPVVYDYEDTVNKIIEFIENDCKLEEKYQKRIAKFYKFHDRNNCKRVYEEIKKL